MAEPIDRRYDNWSPSVPQKKEKETTMENVKFVYIRDTRPKNEGGDPRRVLTVARQIRTDELGRESLRISFCISNPNDQFRKKFARDKTIGLMKGGDFIQRPREDFSERDIVASLELLLLWNNDNVWGYKRDSRLDLAAKIVCHHLSQPFMAHERDSVYREMF